MEEGGAAFDGHVLAAAGVELVKDVAGADRKRDGGCLLGGEDREGQRGYYFLNGEDGCHFVVLVVGSCKWLRWGFGSGGVYAVSWSSRELTCFR